ncbi:MAG: hypothetical protein ACI81F_000106 [Thalassolituus oleivorans]|jgi:hypothetical protein
MKHLFLLTILLSLSPFSMGFEDGFYSTSGGECSSDFIELRSDEGRYRNFSKREDSFSLMFDKYSIDKNGVMILKMGGYEFSVEPSENGVYPMYSYYEGKKRQQATSLHKCKSFDSDVLKIYTDIVAFSKKYPGVNFGVGHSSSFKVRPDG